MKDFSFIHVSGARMDVKTSVVDNNERCTILELVGYKETIFENLFPFHVGSVITLTELKEWYKKFTPEVYGYLYDGEENAMLSELRKTMTITPSITGSGDCDVLITTENVDHFKFTKKITLHSTDEVEVPVVVGYKYSFAIATDGAIWSGDAPADVTISADTDVTLSVDVRAVPALVITSDNPVELAPAETSAITHTSDSTGAVTYASSDATIASVAEDGTITAVAEGEAVITLSQAATTEFRAATATVTVNVTGA